MAGGEKAKSSGEYGEKIVAKILNLIGWENPDSGVKVPCVNEEKHKSKDTKKSIQHGIDYIYQYKCPLRDSTRHDVLISVKCRDGYPKTDTGIHSKFKEFLLDLTYASECYPSCEISRRKINGITKRTTSGIIFWIDRNRNDGKENETVTNKIGNFYFKEECTYYTISLVDNKRAQFIYTLMTYVKNKYTNCDIKFFYINTGLNNSSLDRIFTGNIMPYEYINSDVIPLAITQNNNKILFLGVNIPFCEEYLKRLISLAQDLTSTWSANIVIAFPDYNEFEHSQVVNTAKSAFQDTSFTKTVQVITYSPDFRDEVE